MGAFALFLLLVCPQPAPADRAEIVKMIENLSHDRYAVRERATVELAKRKNAKPVLLAAISKHRDPETVARCRKIVHSIAKAEADGLNPMPYIDAHWYNVATKSYQPEAKHAGLKAYLDAVGADGRPWRNYRWATYAWVQDRLEAGLSPMAMRFVLAELHARDEVFIGQSPPREDEVNPPVVVDWREYLRGK